MPNPSTQIVDIAATVSDIRNYWLLGNGGAATVSGFFVDAFGRRTGASFTTTVAQASGTADPVKIASSIPADAVGAVLRIASFPVYFDIYQDSTGAFSTDFETNYARYPELSVSVKTPLARVA